MEKRMSELPPLPEPQIVGPDGIGFSYAQVREVQAIARQQGRDEMREWKASRVRDEALGAEPVAWWVPAAEQFCIKKPGERPFAKAWQPLYAAAPAWKDVRVDGLPPCDGQTVYVGENSAGYMGCFNMADDHGCWMETPEDDSMIMSDLRYWRVQDRPACSLIGTPKSAEGEGA